MKSLFRAGFVCALGLAASCSDSGSSGTKPTTDPSQIGAEGGLVSAADKSVGASVDIPKGALPSAVKIAVAVSEVDVAPPEGYTLAGPPIAFTPHGLSFDAPVTLTLPYSSSSDTLAVLRLEDEKDKTWEVIDGGKFSDGSATLDVSTFSIYAVAEASSPVNNIGGASGVGEGGAGPAAEGGAANAGAPTDNAGAPPVGGAPSAAGDLTYACDRSNTDGQGLRICSDYFYPALVVQLLGDQLVPGCPGPGNGVLLDACDTTDAVVGCRANNVDAPGITVTNWFYASTKADLMNGVLCTEKDSAWVDPP